MGFALWPAEAAQTFLDSIRFWKLWFLIIYGLVDGCWWVCQGQWLREVLKLHLQWSLGWLPSKKHPGQLCALNPVCAEAIDGHSHKHCVQIRAAHDECVLGHQCLPPVSPPAPLQPQEWPAIKIINMCALKVYPPSAFFFMFSILHVFQSRSASALAHKFSVSFPA